MAADKSPPPLGDVIFEFHTVGQYVKVSAVDTHSLTEVSILGPRDESPEVLKSTALRKLRYVLAKKQNG